MSELTKKHPTDSRTSLTKDRIELHVVGPRRKKREADKALRALGFVEVAATVPWREAFGNISDDALPGVALRGARHKEDLTQAKLSDMTGNPQRHLSEMETGKRPIGRKNAALLAKCLNVSDRIFF